MTGPDRRRTLERQQPAARQFLRFSSVGLAATIVHYAILILCVESGFSGPVPASAAGFVAGAVSGYFLNHRYTFESRARHRDGLPRYLLVAAVGMAFNTGIMWLLSTGLSLHYVLAQAVATGAVLMWTFIANRHWTFRNA